MFYSLLPTYERDGLAIMEIVTGRQANKLNNFSATKSQA
jgi:hypothetical protein